MKKILSLALISILMMGLTSCAFFQEKVIPQAKQKATDGIVKAIAKVGECKAEAQIRLDVEKLLKVESEESMVVKALGSSAPEGSQQEGIVSDICKAAAKLAIPALLDKAAPEKWDCSMSDLSSKVSEIAGQACGAIPI